MPRALRTAFILVVVTVLPLLVVGDAVAGGGFFPSIPPNFVLTSSREVTAEIVLDPNGPIGTPDTPTGGFGAITITRKKATATAVFAVPSPFSSLGDLVYGCNLLRTKERFVELSPGQPGLPLGGPGTAGNWLPTETTISLFEQLGVTLQQSGTIVMIPGIAGVISQRCAPFPASYPNLSAKSGTTSDTQWQAGFLILDVTIGFWAAPGTPTPR